jgi:hypothetical protein
VTGQRTQQVLYVIACGGRPAGDLPRFTERALTVGWDVCVIAIPSGMKFLDPGRLAAITGHPVRSDYQRPDEPDVLPPADAFVVAPATFNTINKLAAGVFDPQRYPLPAPSQGESGNTLFPWAALHEEFRALRTEFTSGSGKLPWTQPSTP